MMRSAVRGLLRPLPAAGMLVQRRFGSSRHKVVDVEDAVYLIPNNSTITVGGFVAQNAPEEVLAALGERYRNTGEPNNLTLVFTGGPGDYDAKGLNHLAQKGMLKRTIGSHYGQTPMIGKMAQENQIESYNFPMGSISRMIRAAASKSPGHLTSVGFGTMADPRNGGGKINEVTTEDIVQIVDLLGKQYLFYKALPIDVAIIRGTTADSDGNISFERESLYVDNMMQAMAARSRRGVVIAQVERVAANGSLNPRNVQIPGTMVDCIVQAKPENHHMSYFTTNNPAATATIRAPPRLEVMPLDERKVIARRAALELTPNQVVNLGIGMPEGVARVADEERVLDKVTLTTEPGVHGGVGLSGHDFGPAVNYDALLQMNQQFDFYNGGGLDVCFLGMAEVNAAGDVNVTRVGKKLTGPGGFIDISQCTKRVNLLGTFTAGGLQVSMKDGKLNIDKEGRVKKFIKSLKETTFSGAVATSNKQVVNYITERAVFHLSAANGMELVEIAPGIDLKQDILAHMEFEPFIRPNLKIMDDALFHHRLMGLAKRSFGLNMSERLHFNKSTGVVYVNLSSLNIHEPQQIKEVKWAIEDFVAAAVGSGKRVDAVINYDGFDCRAELQSDWEELAKYLSESVWKKARRYTHSNAFTRHKLGGDLGLVKDDVDILFDEAWGQVKRLGLMVSEQEFHNMWKHYDTENTGKLTRNQFAKMIAKLQNVHVDGSS